MATLTLTLDDGTARDFPVYRAPDGSIWAMATNDSIVCLASMCAGEDTGVIGIPYTLAELNRLNDADPDDRMPWIFSAVCAHRTLYPERFDPER